MDKKTWLRLIPSVDEMLAHPVLADGAILEASYLYATRQVLSALRGAILDNGVKAMPTKDELARQIAQQAAKDKHCALRRVVNGTGVVLHTNLGRAPLAKEALAAVGEAARSYSNLEYDLDSGARGSRFAGVEGLLTRLTGARAAMVVNNNAAAVLLALAALGRTVIVSRGELVEIGGGFRVPEVCAQSGCRLVEVGTTNKTHLHDYAAALAAWPEAVVLRVHTSNFVMSGFVSRPGLAELSALTRAHQGVLLEDLGSGALVEIGGQPTVADSVRAGADVITFSGDKLLGGPQAGLIVGHPDWLAVMKKHPLARAVRIDKLGLAALEATLRLYIEEATAMARVPVLRMLHASLPQLKKKAEWLAGLLPPQGGACAGVVDVTSQTGGGAMPGASLPSYGVGITHTGLGAQAIEAHFRRGVLPIIGRIAREQFLLDIRTIHVKEFDEVVARYEALPL